MREVIPFRVRLNGVDLQVYEWPGKGVPILLAHATGFHARCWDQVVERLPGRRFVAMDFRGHGLSEKLPPPYPWRNFGLDVAALVRHLGIEGAFAVGHSKGGHSITYAAAIEPAAFSRLLLIDPVIMPRAAYQRPREGGEHFAARRRNEWGSPEEMFESFAKRPPFNRWDPLVLRDYCTNGLVPNADGEGYVLACPPAIEAAVYAGHMDGDIYDEIARIEIPVRILRARPRNPDGPLDMSTSPTAPDVARHFRHAEDVFLPEFSHFIPMEDPGLVARHIEELAGPV